jgi:hypothetical protein
MGNSQVKTSVFQRGVERIFGKALGIVCALIILTIFHHAPLLAAIFTLLGVMVFAYINLAGWWAYTLLNGGLYLAASPQLATSILQLPLRLPPASFRTCSWV